MKRRCLIKIEFVRATIIASIAGFTGLLDSVQASTSCEGLFKENDLEKQIAFIHSDIQSQVVLANVSRATAPPKHPLSGHEKKLETIFNMFVNERMEFFSEKELSDGTPMKREGDPELMAEFKAQYRLQFGKPFDFMNQVYEPYDLHINTAHYHRRSAERSRLTVAQVLDGVSAGAPGAAYFLKFFRDRASRYDSP